MTHSCVKCLHLQQMHALFSCLQRANSSWWLLKHVPSFDVWLTVHRSSMWNKKPTRCHLVLYLFLLYKLLNMFRATLCPSSGDDLAIHLAQPHTNKASCATYSPVDTQPVNRIWLPTQPWVCNLTYTLDHTYTHQLKPPTTITHHTTTIHLTKHENRRTYRPTNTRHIWK